MAWLACLAARRTFLPLDPSLPLARCEAIVAEAAPAAVIASTTPAPAQEAWLHAGVPIIPITSASADAPPLADGLPPAAVGVVLLTSGLHRAPQGDRAA